MIWILAWRNLWRNPRRTVLILTAVVIGVWLMLFMSAYSRGMLVDMVRNSIYTLTGHIQIHARGYLDDPSPQRSFPFTPAIRATLERVLPAGSHWAPRVRLETVASTARHTGGVTLVGIDFARERGLSFLPDVIREGAFPGPGDPDGIVVGAALLRDYHTRLGHKLVLTARNAAGDVVSRAFEIRGVFRSQLEATEKQYVFCRLDSARAFFDLGPSISEISVVLPDMDATGAVTAALTPALAGRNLEVTPWQDLLPTIRTYLEIWDVYLYIWDLVVFIGMAFGLTNTLLMAVYERMREFGLVRALGMKPRQVLQGVVLEASLLLALGLVAANLLNWLTVAALARQGINMSALASGAEYFGVSPVIYPAIDARDVLAANLMTAVLGLIVSLYPAWKAGRFTPVQAITKAT